MDTIFKKKLEEIINNPKLEIQDMRNEFHKMVSQWDFQNTILKKPKKIEELAFEGKELWGSDSHKIETIKTGFKDLDMSLQGLNFGELVVIGGRPSMGKTQFIAQLALQISVSHPVLFFSFDESEYAMTCRFVSSLYGIATNQLITNEMSDETRKKLLRVDEEMQKYQLFLNDDYSCSLAAFQNYCQTQIKEQGIKIIMIDNLQKVSNNNLSNYKEKEIGNWVRALKKMAHEQQVCVIITSQLSRAVEGRPGFKIPQLSDLSDSGSIEQEADKVLLMYRPEFYKIDENEDFIFTAGLVEMILAKNKNGDLAKTYLMVNYNFTQFRNFKENSSEFEFSQERINEIDTNDFPFLK
ncbi:DnaB-like helicase C-terminal domain-containing protein [Flavobacterium sp. RSSA_27]|uniref:DnaB-like helicase C-terminal domain-containing protein n=1 Tax=Flavobacterium sp. RSSA_27 TaxID=3447667 RepID=UPI003F3ED57F